MNEKYGKCEPHESFGLSNKLYFSLFIYFLLGEDERLLYEQESLRITQGVPRLQNGLHVTNTYICAGTFSDRLRVCDISNRTMDTTFFTATGAFFMFGVPFLLLIFIFVLDLHFIGSTIIQPFKVRWSFRFYLQDSFVTVEYMHAWMMIESCCWLKIITVKMPHAMPVNWW